MLPMSIIERIQRLDAQFGRNEGACFGVLDASRLRQGPITSRVLRKHDSVLIFSRDSENVEERFQSKRRETAFARVKAVLGIPTEDRLTERRFLAAGGQKFYFGSKRIYPRAWTPHPRGGK